MSAIKSDKVSNTREALLAELLGDVKVALDRIDALRVELHAVDSSARATATALTDANNQYRAQVDDLVARLRVEMAAVITKTTEHAANTLVSQQTSTLQQAAKIAFKLALSEELIKRTRLDWFKLVGIGALIGSFFCVATLFLVQRIPTWLH